MKKKQLLLYLFYINYYKSPEYIFWGKFTKVEV